MGRSGGRRQGRRTLRLDEGPTRPAGLPRVVGRPSSAVAPPLRAVLLAALPTCSLLACSGDADAPPFTVRDSAGVEIVESLRPAQGQRPADGRSPAAGGPLRVASEPLLRIGVVDGAAEYQLANVEGAVRLADGGIAVADGGSQEVRFFDADGRFLHSVGGPGQGPGEFTGLAALGHAGGAGVWAWDFSLRRITWLDGSGEIVEVTTLAPEPPGLSAVGALDDGSFVLRQLWGVSATAGATESGLRRDPIALVRFDRSGALLDTLAVVPGREVHLTQEGGRGVMTTPPFGRNAVMTLRDDFLVVGTQDRSSLDELALDGSLRRRIVLPHADLTLEDDEVEAYIEERVASVPPADRPGLRSSLSRIPRPDRRPAYGPVASDAAGRLWVGAWTVSDGPPDLWWVVAPEGHLLTEVEAPAGFFPFDIGEDWILGVERDELDVEYVVLYAVSPPGG